MYTRARHAIEDEDFDHLRVQLGLGSCAANDLFFNHLPRAGILNGGEAILAEKLGVFGLTGGVSVAVGAVTD